MRAVVITRPGGPEVLEVQEVETPEPVGDYVRVRVRASGVNRADLLQRAGAYPAPGTRARPRIRSQPGRSFATCRGVSSSCRITFKYSRTRICGRG